METTAFIQLNMLNVTKIMELNNFTKKNVLNLVYYLF